MILLEIQTALIAAALIYAAGIATPGALRLWRNHRKTA